MIYGYCRVSTKGQAERGTSLEDQRRQILSKYPSAEIVSEAYSGYKEERPTFDSLVGRMEKGDTLVATKLDRFCRNAERGLKAVRELLAKGCSIHILNLGLVEDTANGKLMLTILEAFAEFERNMIVERTQSGKAWAREHDPSFKEGRPPKLDAEGISEIKSLSCEEAMERFRISRATYYNYCRKEA